MKTVDVSLGDRSYPIYIGNGLLTRRPELLRQHVPGKKVLVVTNENIAKLYLERCGRVRVRGGAGRGVRAHARPRAMHGVPRPPHAAPTTSTRSTVAALTAGGQLTVESVILPDGEDYKTLTDVARVWDAALAARMDRGTTFLALGGGVVGDMTGFAAACYQRGVHFIQVPTTVMAQVRARVGGCGRATMRRGWA